MNNVLIVDNRKNLFSKVYLNSQTFSGYTYSKNRILKINSDYIFSILKELLYSDKCKYVKEEDDYKVFLDQKNNLYHYLKDGKEDIEMFIKHNAVDACVYYDKFSHGDRLSKDLGKPTSIVLKEFFITASKSVLTALLLSFFAINTISIAQNKLITENVPIIYENSEKITKDDFVYMIANSQNITDEQKQLLLNDDLLNNVISYYQDTNMGYIIKDHLNGITIDYYKGEYSPSFKKASGYYNPLEENRICLQEALTGDYKNEVIGHEFIHLLQNPSCQIYRNICEASAELISSEYYGYEPTSYANARENLEVLIDIVGPEMVWQFNFSNINPLLNTFRNNLSVLESTELEILLRNDGQSVGANNARINELYNILAKNIMSEEEYKQFEFIHSGKILSRTNDLERKRKYYFNSKQMSDKEELYGYSDEEEIVYCKKEITREQYDEYIKQNRDVEIDERNSLYYERFQIPMSEFKILENKDEYSYYDFGLGDFKSYFVENKCKNALKNTHELQFEDEEKIVL